MSRPFHLRVLIAFWAIWLGAAISAPGVLRSYAMHGSHAAHDMAQMDHHSAPAPEHHNHSDCTCIGMGCCAATVSGPSESVVELPTTVATALTAAPIQYTELAPTVAPAHALPFANGPPSARLV